ncbi:MAG TPA: hypothetical protein VEQ63_09365 [Bryobacteraceae bacterium]|nr:hypothetical protein [Bryobacteraceae bacterium]
MSAKIIDVFLMFTADERNTLTTTVGKKRKVVLSKGPNWQGLIRVAKKAEITLNVYGPSKSVNAQAITDSFAKSSATIIVGHGAGSIVGKNWVSNQIKLSDGTIIAPDGTSPGGLVVGNWEGGRLTPASSAAPVKPKINDVTGLFTCNSHDKLRDMFDVPAGSELVSNDGGKDGFTRIGTLEQAAYEFIESFIRNGNVSKSAAKAQAVFKRSGEVFQGDKGDTILLKP